MEGGEIDFDPLTEEGQVDINNDIDNEYERLLPRDGEKGDDFFQRLRSKFKTGWRYAANRLQEVFRERNGGANAPIYLQLINSDYDAEQNYSSSNPTYEDRKAAQDRAHEAISEEYPRWKPKGNFTFGEDEYGRTTLRLNKKNSTIRYLDNPRNFSNTIKEELGPSRETLENYREVREKFEDLFDQNKLDDEYGGQFDIRVGAGDRLEIVNTAKKGNWAPVFNLDGKVNGRLSKAIRDVLGLTRDEHINELEENLDKADEKVKESRNKVIAINQKIGNEKIEMERMREEDNDDLGSEFEKLGKSIRVDSKREETLQRELSENISNREEIQEQIDALEEGSSLKERIKRVFKKHGFTVVAVISAVGITIGVIISSLRSGLSTVAKGVGNGLKTIGKKLGQILPGIVGAIASFLFKTAGEVVKFLASNAWLLIVAVVLYFIERYKKKRD